MKGFGDMVAYLFVTGLGLSFLFLIISLGGMGERKKPEENLKVFVCMFAIPSAVVFVLIFLFCFLIKILVS
jgi:hypothetical protein